MLLQDDQMRSSKEVEECVSDFSGLLHAIYCAYVNRTTPTYCKILPIILGIILNSFVHLLFSNYARNNLSSPIIEVRFFKKKKNKMENMAKI